MWLYALDSAAAGIEPGISNNWRTQRGGVGGSNPPIESSKKFVLCVCKIDSPSPALMFIKSKILARKTLEIVH